MKEGEACKQCKTTGVLMQEWRDRQPGEKVVHEVVIEFCPSCKEALEVGRLLIKYFAEETSIGICLSGGEYFLCGDYGPCSETCKTLAEVLTRKEERDSDRSS